MRITSKVDKELHAAVVPTVQPSLGDVLHFDGRDYSIYMSAASLLALTGARAPVQITNPFTQGQVQVLGHVSKSAVSADADLQAEIKGSLEDIGIQAGQANSTFWQISHTSEDSIYLEYGVGSILSIAESDPFWQGLFSYYSQHRDDWQKDEYGVVDTIYLMPYRLFSCATSKNTSVTGAFTKKVSGGASVPGAGSGSVSAGGGVAVSMLTSKFSGTAASLPADSDFSGLTSPKLWVAAWKMMKLKHFDNGRPVRWTP